MQTVVEGETDGMFEHCQVMVAALGQRGCEHRCSSEGSSPFAIVQSLFNNYLESRDPISLIHLCIPSRAWKDGGFGHRARRREGIPGAEVVWAKAQR